MGSVANRVRRLGIVEVDPCIIIVAITGSVLRKENSPTVPISVGEQIESTHEAYEAGVAARPRPCAP